MSELQGYLQEMRELRCAPLLTLMAQQISALGADVHADVGSFGVRFQVGAATLCELSVFGELFIARVGPAGAVEFRVRNEEVALQALDLVLREYMQLEFPTPTQSAS